MTSNQKPGGVRAVASIGRRLLGALGRRALGPGATPPGTVRAPAHSAGPLAHADPHPVYAGDYTGTPVMTYNPVADGRPDPGEIVWTWVPFEEDHSRGKDRPVLVIGRDDELLLALQLTSKDHDRDEQQERASGRLWMDIGTGDWDRQHRPSEVRVNRILRLDPAAVRREGAVLPADRFAAVAEAVRAAAAR